LNNCHLTFFFFTKLMTLANHFLKCFESYLKNYLSHKNPMHLVGKLETLAFYPCKVNFCDKITSREISSQTSIFFCTRNIFSSRFIFTHLIWKIFLQIFWKNEKVILHKFMNHFGTTAHTKNLSAPKNKPWNLVDLTLQSVVPNEPKNSDNNFDLPSIFKRYPKLRWKYIALTLCRLKKHFYHEKIPSILKK